MNSPYYKRFEVTQEYKGAAHDGLDLVGLDSKEIHATVNGVIHYAGWENPNNHLQGFGQYVCIKGTDNRYYYYGHLSEIKCRIGDSVKITDVIGIEGSTGNSTGSHCHYCIRPQFCKGNAFNVSQISGIPNALGVYDDGYRLPAQTSVTKTTAKTITVEIEFDGKTYAGTLKEKV
jgi:murein DD-endopeptidase MepM/ murein hydrolase activator NlpD